MNQPKETDKIIELLRLREAHEIYRQIAEEFGLKFTPGGFNLDLKGGEEEIEDAIKGHFFTNHEDDLFEREDMPPIPFSNPWPADVNQAFLVIQEPPEKELSDYLTEKGHKHNNGDGRMLPMDTLTFIYAKAKGPTDTKELKRLIGDIVEYRVAHNYRELIADHNLGFEHDCELLFRHREADMDVKLPIKYKDGIVQLTLTACINDQGIDEMISDLNSQKEINAHLESMGYKGTPVSRRGYSDIRYDIPVQSKEEVIKILSDFNRAVKKTTNHSNWTSDDDRISGINPNPIFGVDEDRVYIAALDARAYNLGVLRGQIPSTKGDEQAKQDFETAVNIYNGLRSGTKYTPEEARKEVNNLQLMLN